MTRVIIHAGFYKTATSSLQDFLHQNRAVLKPYFDYYGKADFQSAGATARRYGQRPFPWRRLIFRHTLRRFLASIPDADTIVLSRETFAGVMPGHRDVFGRVITDQTATAITLARVIIQEVKYRFGKGADILFFYTTREPETWLRSIYGHLLRSIKLCDDFDQFHARFATLPDTRRNAETIAKALILEPTPTPVFIARLEDFSSHPFGTAAALLDLADVPDDMRQTLQIVAPQNRGQNPEIQQKFLTLNRSTASKSALKSAKDRLLKTGNSP